MSEKKIDIQTRNMEMSDAIREYVSKRIKRLFRHLPQIDEVRVELTYLKSARSASDRFNAEITVYGKNLLLRAEDRAEDLHAAFDVTLDKMDRQIERYKGRHYRGRGDGRSAAEVAEQVVDESTGELTPLLAKRKKFIIYPMTPEEAIVQMRELGHDNFFIFYNAETSKINVLYRRRNGSYGVIEPEVA